MVSNTASFEAANEGPKIGYWGELSKSVGGGEREKEEGKKKRKTERERTQ